MMALFPALVLLCLLGYVNSENATIPGDDTCGLGDIGPWSAMLEDWATTAPVHSERHGRIMALPAANGYYVTERIDGPFVPPPLPPGHMHSPGQHLPPSGHQTPQQGQHMPPSGQHMPPSGPHMQGQHVPPSGPHMQEQHMPPSGQHLNPPGPRGPQHHQQGPGPHSIHVPQNYNEWEVSPPPAGGKIVNRPPNPYKDKFKPSYAPPTPGPQPNRPQRPNAVDRVDEPPRKQVSETDLYLLGAIEKLVYRVDLMEKRLRKMEESVHYLVAGTEAKPEPCPDGFRRWGGGCYAVSQAAADWKGASLACRKQSAALLELDDHKQRRVLLSSLLANNQLKGTDFWTGGLNPGLLWIWSHSARPVLGNSSADAAVVGEGRCLALVHDPAAGSYVYRGQDCALAHRYICQRNEDKAKLSNDVEKAARSLRLDKGRNSKVLWDDV